MKLYRLHSRRIYSEEKSGLEFQEPLFNAAVYVIGNLERDYGLRGTRRKAIADDFDRKQ